MSLVAPCVSSSVQSTESSVALPPPVPILAVCPARTPSCRWRHSGWADTRDLVYQALQRTHQTPSRQHAFQYCGSSVYVQQSLTDPAVYRLAGSGCHDRFCLPCSQHRSRVIAERVLARIRGQVVRFLTLTLRTDSEPLAVSLDRLYRAFGSLRRSPLWRDHVDGGVAFCEIIWMPQSRRWHPHLHCLIQGTYIQQSALRAAWLAATGDSDIVDIRLVRDDRRASRYVTKYASKPYNSSYLHDPELLDEAVVALKGRRLALTFGSWRGYPLVVPPSEVRWITIGQLDSVYAAAVAGDKTSRAAILALPAGLLEVLLHSCRAPPPSLSVGPVLTGAQATLFDLSWYY